MHPLLHHALKELSAFGLDPAEWLIRKISANGENTSIVFESRDQKDLRLKAQLQLATEKKFRLQKLELVGF